VGEMGVESSKAYKSVVKKGMSSLTVSVVMGPGEMVVMSYKGGDLD